MLTAYIYSLRSLHDDTVLYVGSTSDFNKRKNQHYRALEKGTHENKTLQRIYKNLDGAVYCKIEAEFDGSEIPVRIMEYFYSSMLRGEAHSRGFNMKKGGKGFDMLKHCDVEMASKVLETISNFNNSATKLF